MSCFCAHSARKTGFTLIRLPYACEFHLFARDLSMFATDKQSCLPINKMLQVHYHQCQDTGTADEVLASMMICLQQVHYR